MSRIAMSKSAPIPEPHPRRRGGPHHLSTILNDAIDEIAAAARVQERRQLLRSAPPSTLSEAA